MVDGADVVVDVADLVRLLGVDFDAMAGVGDVADLVVARPGREAGQSVRGCSGWLRATAFRHGRNRPTVDERHTDQEAVLHDGGKTLILSCTVE